MDGTEFDLVVKVVGGRMSTHRLTLR